MSDVINNCKTVVMLLYAWHIEFILLLIVCYTEVSAKKMFCLGHDKLNDSYELHILIITVWLKF